MKLFEDKNKRRAAIITLILHIVLVVLFFIFGLTEPRPLPQDAGASVEFGWEQEAGGPTITETPSTQQPKPQPTTPQQQPQEETVEETATEESSDIAVPDEKQEEESEPEETEQEQQTQETTQQEEPKEEEPEEQQVSDKLNDALNQAWESDGEGDGQGDSQGSGNQGNPDGTDGKGVLGGGSGSWQLSGRSMLPGYGTKIRDTEEEGVVVLNIWVDRSGNVTRVAPNLKESTTTSQYLFNLAKNDVLSNFRFNSDPSANVEQRGKVRYIFELE